MLVKRLFNIVLEVPVSTRQETEIKGTQIRKKEVKLTFFAGDTIQSIENPNGSTKSFQK